MKKKIILKEADLRNLVKQTILEWGNSFDDDPRFRYSNIDNKEYDEETGEEGYPAIFGDKEGYLHMNKWGDTNTQMFDDKSEDNEESWDELEFDTDDNLEKRNKRLGSNAQDIFDGNYDVDPDIDYFEDSDYRYTNNYWDDKDLTDIQKDRIADDWKEKDRQHEAVIHKITESVMKQIKKMKD